MKHSVILPSIFLCGLSLNVAAAPFAVHRSTEPLQAPPTSFVWQAQVTGSGEDDDGSLMERGVELFFKGLREEMAPTLDGLQGLLGEIGPSFGEFLAEMGPALAEIASRVEDWSAYELPEMLPNGDIIIRRKQDKDVSPDGPVLGGDGDIEI